MPIGESGAELHTHTSKVESCTETPKFQEVHTDTGHVEGQEGGTRSGDILQAMLYKEDAKAVIGCILPSRHQYLLEAQEVKRLKRTSDN